MSNVEPLLTGVNGSLLALYRHTRHKVSLALWIRFRHLERRTTHPVKHSLFRSTSGRKKRNELWCGVANEQRTLFSGWDGNLVRCKPNTHEREWSRLNKITSKSAPLASDFWLRRAAEERRCFLLGANFFQPLDIQLLRVIKDDFLFWCSALSEKGRTI